MIESCFIELIHLRHTKSDRVDEFVPVCENLCLDSL